MNMARTKYRKSKFFIVMMTLLLSGIMLVGVTFAMETLSLSLNGEKEPLEKDQDC